MFAAGKTKGAAAAVAANYIEDVFSTWLWTGDGGTTKTLSNGIDLTGKGGMVWIKNRTSAGTNPTTSSYNVNNHFLFDTARTNQNALCSSAAVAQDTSWGSGYFNFLANGFNTGSITNNTYLNASGQNYTSWTFRKQPKFFDVVTYTGNGAGARYIPHSLASSPGCVIVKRTDSSGNWWVAHIGAELANGGNPASTSANFALNTTNPYSYSGAPYSVWAFGSNSATFYVNDQANISGATYVAYLFAHNAGGFGLTGTDNVISCGSFTTDTSGNATVNLGYEPQWVLTKRVDTSGNWVINDNMRGMPASQTSQVLYPNLSNAESSSIYFSTQPNATGFTTQNYANTSYDGVAATVIYIAIRRGPMKTPTSGTSVFSPQTFTGSGTGTTNFPVDLVMTSNRPGAAANSVTIDRLRGASSTANILYLSTSKTAAEVSDTGYGISLASNTSFVMSGLWAGSAAYWAFRRAPGFFDEVCWNGTNSDQTLNHNLGVVPELLIFKPRTQAGYNWEVSTKYTGSDYLRLVLQLTNAGSTLAYSGGGPIPAAPTATQFSVGQFYNPTGGNVAYLFASCPGVSKVGSYTGNGSSQTINCGFTGGARFVLIKRTDSTGDWYVYDTARGMTTLTDPYLLLNSTAAESATLGSVTTVSTGFAVNASILAAINTNAASYIFLAIA